MGMTTFAIDLNVRVRGGQTYVGHEDLISGPFPVRGQVVRVVEEETGVEGTATVAELDSGRRLIYLAVDWSSLASPPPMPPSSGCLLKTGLRGGQIWQMHIADASAQLLFLQGMSTGWRNGVIHFESDGVDAVLPSWDNRHSVSTSSSA